MARYEGSELKMFAMISFHVVKRLTAKYIPYFNINNIWWFLIDLQDATSAHIHKQKTVITPFDCLPDLSS